MLDNKKYKSWGIKQKIFDFLRAEVERGEASRNPQDLYFCYII